MTNILDAAELWEKLKRREALIRDDLEENESLIMEYHAPTGEKIWIYDVGYYQDADAMILVGTDPTSGEECQVVASPLAVQLVFRVAKDEPERRRIGFWVEDASGGR